MWASPASRSLSPSAGLVTVMCPLAENDYVGTEDRLQGGEHIIQFVCLSKVFFSL